MFEISKKKKLKKFIKITRVSNRQDSGKYFYPSGDIYISLISNLLKNRSFFEKNTFPYIMKKNNTIDIDDIYDFMLGQIKFKISKK
jgi:CMP-N-acetylneuraminic acid synthetase